MATPLKKLNETVAGLLQAQAFAASLGSPTDDVIWASAVPKILNGNSMLVVPGPLATQITVKSSAMVMTVPITGFVKVDNASDQAVTSVSPIPPGARNDVTNYFFSQFVTWNETPVLLYGKFSHIYTVYDATKTGNFAIGIISNASVADPNPALLTNLGVSVSARQAVCFVNGSGKVTLLKTFPGIFNTTATVVADAPTDFADWAGDVTAVPTNVIFAQFTFPAGVGTGAVGEFAVKLGPDIVAFLPVSPQLLKDADVPLVLKWTLMVGEPGAFLP